MTSKFLSQALIGENNGWLYLVAIVAVIFGYFIGQLPFALMAYLIAVINGGMDSIDFADALARMDMELLGVDKNLGLGLLLLMFVMAFGLFWLCLSRLHHRPMRSVITAFDEVNWSKIRFGFGLWIALGILMELGSYYFNPENYIYTFQWRNIVTLVIICLTILPIQTTFEEVFFRGYLLQGLASWFHRRFNGSILNTRIALVMITAILFSAVHAFNPEVYEYGFVIMMANYIMAGVFLGIITVMDDGLELAIGAHWATNFFGAVLVGYNHGAIQTDSIFKMQIINPYLSLLTLILSGTIFAIWCKRKYKWPAFTLLFSQIQLQKDDENEIFAEYLIE